MNALARPNELATKRHFARLSVRRLIDAPEGPIDLAEALAYQLFDDAFFFVELDIDVVGGALYVAPVLWPRLEVGAEARERIGRTLAKYRSLGVGIEMLPPRLRP